jgi:hypothetical protein
MRIARQRDGAGAIGAAAAFGVAMTVPSPEPGERILRLQSAGG